jgi:mannose-6-phosphate isomerase-like protein (cupin superfamily)
MRNVDRGRLAAPTEAPGVGERTVGLGGAVGFVVEQVLSGQLELPVEYVQAFDEWVVLLSGAAVLEVDGEALELTDGDWCLLPRGTPHRLVSTAPGTSWLTVTNRDG